MKKIALKTLFGTQNVFLGKAELEKNIIQLYTDDEGFWEPWATATVSVENLYKDEVAIKNYSENAGILEALMENNIVQYLYDIYCGMAILNICMINKDIAMEYAQ